MPDLSARVTTLFARLRRDRSGVTVIEFAYALPIVLGLGLYAVECTNLALVNLRVSQAALNLADNASRVGLQVDSSSTQQLREIDLNDVLDGSRLYGEPWKLTERGRITLSSLEKKDGEQRIHWQRCLGQKRGADFDSHYGTTDIADGTSTQNADKGTLRNEGMGEPGARVHSPEGSGVMFVEINYEYQPVVSSAWLPQQTTVIRYTGSFIVRDRREFSQLYNPDPAAERKTCNLYTAA